MTVKFENNVLTVVTPIDHKIVKTGIADLALYDEKTKEETFSVETGEKPVISRYRFTCNAVVEDKLAVVIVLPIGTTKEEVMKKYGKSLVVAKPLLEEIASKAKESEEAINNIFA